jgi:hypothetical protein
MELGIGSTDWFDGSLFNTEGTEPGGEHRGRDDLAGICRDFWPGQSLPRLNQGGKMKLVGGVTTRTIAAKRDGAKASPSPPAADPRIRGDCFRSFGIISDLSRRRFIGRASSQRVAEIGLLMAAISHGPMFSFPMGRTGGFMAHRLHFSSYQSTN